MEKAKKILVLVMVLIALGSSFSYGQKQKKPNAFFTMNDEIWYKDTVYSLFRGPRESTLFVVKSTNEQVVKKMIDASFPGDTCIFTNHRMAESGLEKKICKEIRYFRWIIQVDSVIVKKNKNPSVVAKN